MKSRSGVKITIYLLNTVSCFSYFQHIRSVVTDLVSGRKFDIDFPRSAFNVYSAEDETPIEEKAKSCCMRTISLYSTNDFDSFVHKYTDDFVNKNYNMCTSNCADAVKFSIDYFCPDQSEFEKCCFAYKVLCCWGFFPSLGMKCFPSIFFTTPSDVFDLALALSHTQYGIPPEIISDKVSIAVLTANNALSLLPRPASSELEMKAEIEHRVPRSGIML